MLLAELNSYEEFWKEKDPETQRLLPKFRALLSTENSFYRTRFPAHFTASAFIVSDDFSEVLFLHHRKLQKWLQPGGHADGDEDLRRVAAREVEEETGLSDLGSVLQFPIDIDIHKIPANQKEQEHEHYDVRYLLVARSQEQVRRNEESNDLRWFKWEDGLSFAPEPSIARVYRKLIMLK